MKPRRLILLFAPFACILLCLLLVRVLFQPKLRAYSTGERLSIVTLGTDEEIVISKVFAHGRVKAHEYHIGGERGPRFASAFSAEAEWEDRQAFTRPREVLAARSLSLHEAQGLDATIDALRSAKREVSSAMRQLRITYFRKGKKIGEEFYVDLALPDELRAVDRNSRPEDLDGVYARIEQYLGIPRADLEKMLPFEVIEEKEPNQALEPTRGAVTPRAP